MKNKYDDGINNYSFKLVNIQSFSYRDFLKSNKPEELLLAILADFEDNHPEIITDKILEKAKMITDETFTIEKFVNQFEIISKIRNLGTIVYQKTRNNMPLDIKIEELYSYNVGKEAGIKEGIKEGIREGYKERRDEMILAMLKIGKLNIEDIAKIADVSISFIRKMKKSLENH
jgi:hypothetical protein